MSRTIPDDVLAVLESATIDGHQLRITTQLDRALYTATNKVLQALGGRWNRSAGAHLFSDPVADVLDDAILSGLYTDARKDFDAFYTPPAVAAQVIELADISEGHWVLEPSAGAGALALAAVVAGAERVEAHEIRATTPAWWEGVPQVVMSRPVDFLTLDPAAPHAARFDRVVMNPPFSRQQDIAHVRHAFEFLKPGGRLVAVMSPGFQWRTSKASAAFRDWATSLGAEVQPLPDGSFRESGTDVRTCIVAVDKP